MLVVDSRISIPLRELTFQFAKSSGPGGQHVNKTSSKALLRWNVVGSPSIPESVRTRFLARYGTRVTKEGELVLTSQRFRDQGRNCADCLEKLRAMLVAVARPPRPRRKTKPTAASRERRLTDKKRRSDKKRTRRGSFDDD